MLFNVVYLLEKRLSFILYLDTAAAARVTVVVSQGAVHKEGESKSSFFGSPPTRTNFWGVAIARG